MNTTVFKNDLLTKQIEKLVEKNEEPMSIIQIKEKYGLSFPFQVRRVRDSIGFGTWSGVTTITGFRKPEPSKGLTHIGTNNERISGTTGHIQSAEVEDYVLHETGSEK